MSIDICKLEMFWKVHFVNYASIFFNEIDNSNTNYAQFCKKLFNFLIIVSYA